MTLMKVRRAFLIIELLLIFIYYLMVLFSIDIQPIYLILGFLNVFILPGYNLLNLLKPNYPTIQKLGYTIIISLAIENIYMFFCYIFFYNFSSSPEVETYGYIFNSSLLIQAIIIINLSLILIKEYRQFRSKIKFNKTQVRKSPLNLRNLKNKLNYKSISVLIFFGISLIFMCISTIYSNVPQNDYRTNVADYRVDFTFFYRVPLIFYPFLISSILSFIYIIFFIKNHYIILISISIFLYCIWILPYLQIGNYFGHDTVLLARSYEVYINHGIVTHRQYNFVVWQWDSLRYSTALFSTILLISATNMNLDFTLWYLYPMLYILIPFFFYSVFKKFYKKKKDNLILIIMVIFISFAPFFTKSGHATGTGVIGVLVYFILVIELFNLTQKHNFNISNSFLIIFLYLFLCLTHFEESIYFLILMVLYIIYLPLYKIVKQNFRSKIENSNDPIKAQSIILGQIVEKELISKKLKKTHFKLSFLLIILILVFYLVNEFFGWLELYFLNSVGSISFLEEFFEIYVNSKNNISFLVRGSIDISILVIIIIILGVFLFCYLFYFIFFRNYNLIIKIYNFGIKLVKKIYNFITKLISKKYFPLIYFPLIIFLTIYLEIFFLGGSRNFVSVIVVLLSYLIFIFQIFFFIKGVTYYELKNNIQNFFLLSLIASSSVMVVLIGLGNFWLAIYLLHSKFSAFFIFFNLIIIQNTYFKDLKKKNFKYITYVFLFVSLGAFYSLRKISFG